MRKDTSQQEDGALNRMNVAIARMIAATSNDEHAQASIWIKAWNDEYAALLAFREPMQVGNPDIDRQHRKLFKLSHQVLQLLEYEASADIEQAHSALTDLTAYARQHFVKEERILARNGYPDLASHMAMHSAFLDTLDAIVIQAKLNHIDKAAILEAIADLSITHVFEIDMACKNYMKGQDR
ncbi:MAG: bacteriohemerythrin [Rhodoferax sp.]